jgi:hypothetical protein
MADPTTPIKPASRGLRLPVLIGALAVLAPLGYLAGRTTADTFAGTYYAFLGSGIAVASLGALIGIPIGLFFGSFRAHSVEPPAAPARPNTLEMEREILTQLRRELVENQSLFEARKGSTVMFARIAYITPFWTSIKASGRLFVMQDAALLNVIASAYYWLEQASHLEILAYEAKYSKGDETTSPAVATHLINEVRLLDGQIENALASAIAAIDNVISPR